MAELQGWLPGPRPLLCKSPAWWYRLGPAYTLALLDSLLFYATRATHPATLGPLLSWCSDAVVNTQALGAMWALSHHACTHRVCST